MGMLGLISSVIKRLDSGYFILRSDSQTLKGRALRSWCKAAEAGLRVWAGTDRKHIPELKSHQWFPGCSLVHHFALIHSLPWSQCVHVKSLQGKRSRSQSNLSTAVSWNDVKLKIFQQAKEKGQMLEQGSQCLQDQHWLSSPTWPWSPKSSSLSSHPSPSLSLHPSRLLEISLWRMPSTHP